MTSSISNTRDRVRHHRGRRVASGIQRVELSIPDGDVSLVRRLAATLREGGAPAERLRAYLVTAVGAEPARTGAELVAFFRNSPLVGEVIEIERDRSQGRPVEL
jgi:hypothetical protein